MDKEIISAIISLVSAVASGWMLYKTNINKDSIKEKSSFLNAEEAFRQDILKENKNLRDKNEDLSKELNILIDEVGQLKDKVSELESKLSKRIDKIKIISSFLKYLPTPAWLKIKAIDGYKLTCVNGAYSTLFDVSEDYCKSAGDHLHLSDDLKKFFNLMELKVQKVQKGIKADSPVKINQNNKCWYLVKFPIIEDGEIIAIGGVLLDCEC